MKTFIKILVFSVVFSHTEQKTWGTEALNDSNFRTAIDLWISNESEANATYGHISNWNTSAVTDMSYLFRSIIIDNFGNEQIDNTKGKLFNEDISQWDVSSVTNMAGMFMGAEVFNQDIGDWDVSSVTNMEGMFY